MIRQEVHNCPEPGCSGRAILSYDSVPVGEETSQLKEFLSDVACNRDGCSKYVSSERVKMMLRRDPR